MIMSNVTPSDIAAEIGRPLTTAETAQVTQWISDAELLINTRLGAEGMTGLDSDLYAFIVRQAVVRRLERVSTGSATSKTVSVDDASVTTRYDEFGGSNNIYWWFLPEWWDLIDPKTSGAFSTRPGFTPDTCGLPDWWFTE